MKVGVTSPLVGQPAEVSAMASSPSSYREASIGASKSKVRQIQGITSTHLIWELFALRY